MKTEGKERESTRKKNKNPFIGTMSNALEKTEVVQIGKRLFSYARKHENAFNPLSSKWWNKQLLAISMMNPRLKDQLFQTK